MSIETPSIHAPGQIPMREQITVTVQLVFDCSAEPSKEEQAECCKADIDRLFDADSTTGVALTGYTVTRVQSEAETYGTTAPNLQSFNAENAGYALASAYPDTDETAYLLRNMLSDLRHFADKNGLDFADEDRAAYDNYCKERGVTS